MGFLKKRGDIMVMWLKKLLNLCMNNITEKFSKTREYPASSLFTEGMWVQVST